ncbi:exopolysaccharide biosynthesis polyprenyl glycosylphosphotransferase [Dietzia alimentaria]|uniref:exopolysaccharide biosynthesis polyprenyl glycosylphosphotransferase n=1 Tax=Dietzia alimentaria TaxID=665550 RepID=UPI00029B3AA9|nr:exopolysaccharide biosynthesis polyprenyl glycosylphosphotransferase [Dietzia alimentaria]
MISNRTAVVAEPSRRLRLSRTRTDLVLLALDTVVLVVVMAALVEIGVEAVAAAFAVILAVELTGNYRSLVTLSVLNDAPRLAGSAVVGSLVLKAAFEGDDSIRALLVMIGCVFLSLFVIRALYYSVVRQVRRRSVGARRRTVIVGGGLVASELLESIYRFPELGLTPVAVVDSDPLLGADQLPVPILDRPLHDVVSELDVQTVIVAFRNAPDSSLVSPLRQCDQLDCEIFLVPRLFEFVHLNSDMDRIHTIPLIRVRRHIHRTWYWHAKRVFDVTVAGTALILLAPLLALTAVAVKLTSPEAPVLFRQVRVGGDEREFLLYKFRSMRPVDGGASDTDWHSENRISPLGRFLRTTSIDELPQLWNVVRGDMSLVGPRPERPHFVEQFAQTVPSYGDRHRVTAGLTGWAAINGLRGDTSITDRALYDNFYIQNWSIWLDIKILLLTARAVVARTGA